MTLSLTAYLNQRFQWTYAAAAYANLYPSSIASAVWRMQIRPFAGSPIVLLDFETGGSPQNAALTAAYNPTGSVVVFRAPHSLIWPLGAGTFYFDFGFTLPGADFERVDGGTITFAAGITLTGFAGAPAAPTGADDTVTGGANPTPSPVPTTLDSAISAANSSAAAAASSAIAAEAAASAAAASSSTCLSSVASASSAATSASSAAASASSAATSAAAAATSAAAAVAAASSSEGPSGFFSITGNEVTQGFYNLATTAGVSEIAIGGANFTNANVGDYIRLQFCGPAAQALWLTTKITSVTDSTHITVRDAPTQSVNVTNYSAEIMWGTDQAVGLQSYIDTCRATRSTPRLGSGIYLVSQTISSRPSDSAAGYDNNFDQPPALLMMEDGAIIVAVEPMTSVVVYGSNANDYSGFIRSATFGGGMIDGGFLAKYGADIPMYIDCTRRDQVTKNTLLAGVRWGNLTATGAGIAVTSAYKATGGDGSGGVNGAGVYALVGGVGTPATLNCTWAGGILTVNSVASAGSYSVMPTNPATISYVSGAATGWTGATVNARALPNGGGSLDLNCSHHRDITYIPVTGISSASPPVVTTQWQHGLPATGTVTIVGSGHAALDGEHLLYTPIDSTHISISNVTGAFTSGACNLAFNMPSCDPDFHVASITAGSTTTIQVDSTHNYVAGQIVELTDVQGFGATLDGLFTIASVPDQTKFVINVNTTGMGPYLGYGFVNLYRDPATVEKFIYFENAGDADWNNLQADGVRVGVYANPAVGGWDSKGNRFHFNNYAEQGPMKAGVWMGGNNVISNGQVDLPVKFAYRFTGWDNDLQGCRLNYQSAGATLGARPAYASFCRLDSGASVTISGGGAKADASAPLLSLVSAPGMLEGYAQGLTLISATQYNVQFSFSSILQSGGYVNLFRNGGFEISQRGPGPLVISTSGGYLLDGWGVVPTGASVTAQLFGGRARTSGSLAVTGQAGVTGCIVRQKIEVVRAARLQNTRALFQCWVYNGTSAAITPNLIGRYPSASDNWATPVADTSVALQACQPGTWTLLSASAVPKNPYLGYEFGLDFGGALNAAGSYIEITEADVRAWTGSATALPTMLPQPEFRPGDVELNDCRRFYRQTVQASAAAISISAYNAASGSNSIIVPLNPPMRAPPAAALIGAWSQNNATSFGFSSLGADLAAFSWQTTALGNSGGSNPANGGWSLSAEFPF